MTKETDIILTKIWYNSDKRNWYNFDKKSNLVLKKTDKILTFVRSDSQNWWYTEFSDIVKTVRNFWSSCSVNMDNVSVKL